MFNFRLNDIYDCFDNFCSYSKWYKYVCLKFDKDWKKLSFNEKKKKKWSFELSSISLLHINIAFQANTTSSVWQLSKH